MYLATDLLCQAACPGNKNAEITLAVQYHVSDVNLVWLVDHHHTDDAVSVDLEQEVSATDNRDNEANLFFQAKGWLTVITSS